MQLNEITHASLVSFTNNNMMPYPIIMSSPLLLTASRPFRQSIRALRKGQFGTRKPTMSDKLAYREEPRYKTLEAIASKKGIPVADYATDHFEPVDAFEPMKEKNYPFFEKVEHRMTTPYYLDHSLPAAQLNKQIFNIFPANKSAVIWPGVKEEIRGRRLLPVPVSMTGLGLNDGVSAKYWTTKITGMIEKLEREINHQDSEHMLDNVTPGVRLLLEDGDAKLSKEHMELRDFYQKEKERSLSMKEQEDENKAPVIFPHALAMRVREKLDEEIQLQQQQNQSLLDQEYDQYKKHRNILTHFAKGLSNLGNKDEFDSEIEGWKNDFWRRSYGHPDPTIPPSKIPCGGCGAVMHCVDPGLPGYLPSENFKQMTKSDLRRGICQRCEFLDHFNVSIDVNVPQEEYPAIISKIKEAKAIVIMMIDLLDFPCSMWPDMVHLFGKDRKIFVVGNKVDLLPQDEIYHLDRIEKTIRTQLHHAGIDPKNNVHAHTVHLISAKTGYGVESLITKLYEHWKPGKEDIYLIGCTNVGKSTLFNTMLQSDLCAVRENDLIQRATTSLWPGTTLSLLKFPILRMQGWQKYKRSERLKMKELRRAKEHEMRRSLYRQTGHYVLPMMVDRVGMTFRNELPFTTASGHPMAKRGMLPAPFNEHADAYKDCNYVYDTPGTVYKDQLLAMLTTDELLKTIPRELITPRVFSMQPYQSLFIAGLGRIDLIHSRQNVLLTVFASKYLPIHVVYTQEANRFYNMFLGSELLGVPIGDQERLKHFPPLIPKEIDNLKGINWTESCGDVVLSSAGWVSVTMGEGEECVMKAFTPDGRGIFVRQPSLLPFAVRMRGRRIVDTPCYQTRIRTINDFEEERYAGARKLIDHRDERHERHSYKAFQTRGYKVKQNYFGWHEVDPAEFDKEV